ncbi:MAG TPA: FG-GAP-like repeat-containing protein [Flavipsychrobacter sp.]|nr:FG-GAP-like repeat-containing protein [Flavipsychrobacter sp.]
MKRVLLIFFGMLCWDASAQTPAVKWFFNVKDMAFGQSAAADIDNDGKFEIVFSTYRNDSTMYVLNGENGTLKWKYNVGGCADAAPLIYDVDKDGDYEIVLAGSCNPKTFCFDADSGFIQWQTPMYGSDSPPSIADLDNDGKLEIIHGQFGGYVISINAENGSVNWNIPVDTSCWVQTAPAIMDVNNDGQLDFIVGTWSFTDTASAIYCYRGDNHALLWKNALPKDVMYHGAAFGDMDKDGKKEITIGDYNAEIYCLNAENGSVNWRDSFPTPYNYIGAPTSLADLDNDGWLDVVICDAYHVRARKHNGGFLWDYTIPNNATAFRGVAIADINNDNVLDVTFGTSKGLVISISGLTGAYIKSFNLAAHYGGVFEVDHAPIIADFDGDGVKDVFVVGGHAEYMVVLMHYRGE